jgi:hypothetical protein
MIKGPPLEPPMLPDKELPPIPAFPVPGVTNYLIFFGYASFFLLSSLSYFYYVMSKPKLIYSLTFF